MRIGRVPRAVLACLLAAVLAAALVSGYVFIRRSLAVSRLEERIGMLKAETVPLRFVVLSRSDQSVSARFIFYDADGREIAMFERSWNGSELAIDAVLVPVGERFLAFPARVFTDATAARRGTELFGYYDRGGFPAVFDSASLDAAARDALSVLFSKAKSFDADDGTGKTSIAPEGPSAGLAHVIKRLRDFEIGAVYAFVFRADGVADILRE